MVRLALRRPPRSADSRGWRGVDACHVSHRRDTKRRRLWPVRVPTSRRLQSAIDQVRPHHLRVWPWFPFSASADWPRQEARLRASAVSARILLPCDGHMVVQRINSTTGSLAHHRRCGQILRAPLAARLGVAGLALAFLVEVAGLCLCVPGSATASCGANGCCPGRTAPQASPAHSSSTASVQPLGSKCCPQSLSASALRAEPREPVGVSWPSERAPALVPAAQPTRILAAVGAPLNASSPPRSPILRI